MSGATFGRKGGAPDPELAARRAAFVAAERARAAAAPADDPNGRDTMDGFSRPAPIDRPYASTKTTSTAYLFWLLLGGFAAHRFYLGFTTSAIIQILLTPIGYALLLSKSPAGFLLVGAAGIWMIADAFLIPGLVRQANDRARRPLLASTFA